MNIPKSIRQQQQDIFTLLQRTEALLAARGSRLDGEHVDHTYVGEVVFLQRDTNSLDVIFQIPDNVDFVAKRFSLFPFFRFTTTDESSNGVPETSFRPCLFSSTPFAFNDVYGRDNAVVDCAVTLSEASCDASRALSNTPVPVSLLSCGAVNYRPAEIGLTSASKLPSYYPNAQHGSGVVFPGEGYAISRGSSLSVRVSPSFANDRVDPAALDADVTEQNEYKLVVTLEGYKVVK